MTGTQRDSPRLTGSIVESGRALTNSDRGAHVHSRDSRCCRQTGPSSGGVTDPMTSEIEASLPRSGPEVAEGLKAFLALIPGSALALTKGMGAPVRHGVMSPVGLAHGGSSLLLPVGGSRGSLRPVNCASLQSAVAPGKRRGGVVASGGRIEALVHVMNEHAKGEARDRRGGYVKCFPHRPPDGGPSSDGQNYITFESTWTFKTDPPNVAGLFYWIKQKLYRLVILYCPLGQEKYRIETLINETFRLHGGETDPKYPDVHQEPRRFDPCEELATGEKAWCQMTCYELGILGLQETTDEQYKKEYARTEETESYTSSDGGKTWGPREGHGNAGQDPPPPGMATVPGYVGYYIVAYYIEHCVSTEGPGSVFAPLGGLAVPRLVLSTPGGRGISTQRARTVEESEREWL